MSRFALALTTGLIFAAWAHGASFQRIDGIFEGMRDLSDDGSTAVGYTNSAAGQCGAIWKNDSLQSLSISNTFPMSSSADGSIVVGWSPGSGPFMWQAPDQFTTLAILPGMSDGMALRTNASGSIVGGLCRKYGLHSETDEACIWQSGTVRGLGYLSSQGSHSRVTAISANGSIVAGVSDNMAFRWDETHGMSYLGNTSEGHATSSATAMSADGLLIFGVAGINAFCWQDGYATDLGTFSITDVSANGSIAVGVDSALNARGAVIWDATNGVRVLSDVLTNEYGLDLQGYRLDRAIAISADGTTILGSGDSYGRYWIATIPEPATVALFTLGAFIIGGRRRA